MNLEVPQIEPPRHVSESLTTPVADISIGRVNRQNAAEVQVAKAALSRQLTEATPATPLTDLEFFLDIALTSTTMQVIRKRHLTSDGHSSNIPVGLVYIGEDENKKDGPATTLFYARVHPELKGTGEMTIGLLQVIERILQRQGLPPRRERGTKDSIELQHQLEKRPLRVYIKENNTASIALAERIGFRRVGPGTGIHSEEIQYNLDINCYDSSWELQEKQHVSTPLPDSLQVTTA